MKMFTWVIYPILLTAIAIGAYIVPQTFWGFNASNAAGFVSAAMLAMTAAVIGASAIWNAKMDDFEMEMGGAIGSSFTAMLAACAVSSYATNVPLTVTFVVLCVICMVSLLVLFVTESAPSTTFSTLGPSIVIIVAGVMDGSGSRASAELFVVLALIAFLLTQAVRPVRN